MQITESGPRELRIPGTPAPLIDERPLYRFDGHPAQRSFLRDLFDAAGVGGRNQPTDPDAARYLAPYLASGDLAARFANVDTGDVASLAPPVRSPVAATPLVSYSRPLWDAVTNGQLSSALSVTVPRVTASTGGAAEHVEGTEPTDGTFTVTADDDAVPKPISGKLTLNRELLDFAAPALVDQVAFGEMRATWAEVVEARIAALLDGLTVTEVTLNGTDDQLDAQWLDDLLVPLQQVRGGRELRSLVLANELYAPTAGARDGQGRRLYQLVPGGAVDLGSHQGVPAWALTAANGGDGKSYLFDRAVVYAQEMVSRFTFDSIAVSKVVLAIWGHSAEWCTRPASVRRLTYAAI